MDTYEDKQIQELPLGVPLFKDKVENFLRANGLRLEKVDLYLVIQDADDNILAGGGLAGDTIKCIAVSSEARSAGLSAPLVSALVSEGARRGYSNIKVFTKPENRAVFESLGFRMLAEAPKAILMENGRGLAQYCDYLQGCLDFARHDKSFRPDGELSFQPDNGSSFLPDSELPFRPDCGSSFRSDVGSSFRSDDGLSFRPDSKLSFRPEAAGRSGEIPSTVIIMNANPFHRGHLSLVERAAEGGAPVYVIVVKEDVSRFCYADRLAMVREGCANLANVTVLEGSDYQISASTFPTYFLKEITDASDTQMRLDLDLFCRHIAPALNAGVRVVGSEPSDALTARYNALMKEVLPSFGLSVQEFPRFGDVSASLDMTSHFDFDRTEDCHFDRTEDCHLDWTASCHFDRTEDCHFDRTKDCHFDRRPKAEVEKSPICGTDIRTLLDSEDGFFQAIEMVPESSRPYLYADRAAWALKKELSLPCKPGLVGPDGSGAHSDMDYSLMLKSIAALRPFFARFAVAKDAMQLRSLGLEAEKAMLAATGGVNTHKGAIFALGLALFGKEIAKTASALDNGAAKQRDGVIGAMQMAREGYKDLFQDWLPYYRSVKKEEYGAQKTLLRIMSSLDDTCIIGRAGLERAREVKKEASALLENFCPEWLKELCRQYKAENISPGGAADMLALTFFIDSTQKVNI